MKTVGETIEETGIIPLPPDQLRYYLAGKIGKNDWRHDLLPLQEFDGSDEWRGVSIVRGLLDGCVYMGPFFTSCDHGCGHGSARHGCASPGGSCDAGSEHSWLTPTMQKHVFTQCCNAIDQSDIVFAWFDDMTAFGTLWELGYASAKSKRVFLGIGKGADPQELWFAGCNAERVFSAGSATDALQMVRNHVDGERSALRLIESPIERMMLTGLRWWFQQYDPVRNGWMHGLLVLMPQMDVTVSGKHYRLDFAIRDEFSSLKIAVECDGHDFHERTPEQAMRDRERDRLLQIDGWTVLRFTGREIHRDLEKCTAQIWDAIMAPSRVAEAAQ